MLWKPAVDCKRFETGSLAGLIKRLPWLAGLLCWTVLASTLCGDQPAEQQAGEQKVAPPPQLTLESLFHPDHKQEFEVSVPATHWIGQSSSQLLVRRKESWNEVDLKTGDEQPWPGVAQLRERLLRLEGVEEEQAKAAAMSAVATMREPQDTILVRIGKALAIASTHAPARWLTRDASNWNDATMDPTARRIGYTRDGDMFVVDADSGRTLRLTDDGSETLLDGVLDWTYQEEIFGRGNFKGFWFSPDGQTLAMLRIDISGIEPYFLPSSSSDRGRGVVSRYPKAGDPIPHAELYVWDLSQFDAGVVPPAKLIEKSTAGRERLITGVWWHPFQRALLYSVSDRTQTWRELRAVSQSYFAGATDNSMLLLREESPAWVEPPVPPGWLRDGSLIWRSEVPSGHQRLYHLSANGKVVTPISPPGVDVRDFHVRPDGSFLLLTADASGGTVDQQLYRLNLAEKQSPLVPLTTEPGWHAATPSPDGRWFVDQHSTPVQPPGLAVQSTQDELRFVLAQPQLNLPGQLIVPEMFQIPADGGVSLPALLVRPSTATAEQPVPVVVEVYGGPGNPLVSSRWGGKKSLYRELLARRGIASLLVDNRSSAGRGIADTWEIRGRVGELELQDLLTAVDWLKAQPWVDADRLALRGWSFGGFLTLYAMTHSEAFTAGIAGGSVTQWGEYDAFYTERYMGLPSENAEGYKATSPLATADKLHGHLLLIHGEADDNVHPSQTLRMAAALQKAGKDFRLMIYPGAAHGITDPHQGWHLAQMTDHFLVEHLLRRSPDPQ